MNIAKWLLTPPRRYPTPKLSQVIKERHQPCGIVFNQISIRFQVLRNLSQAPADQSIMSDINSFKGTKSYMQILRMHVKAAGF